MTPLLAPRQFSTAMTILQHRPSVSVGWSLFRSVHHAFDWGNDDDAMTRRWSFVDGSDYELILIKFFQWRSARLSSSIAHWNKQLKGGKCRLRVFLNFPVCCTTRDCAGRDQQWHLITASCIHCDIVTNWRMTNRLNQALLKYVSLSPLSRSLLKINNITACVFNFIKVRWTILPSDWTSARAAWRARVSNHRRLSEQN